MRELERVMMLRVVDEYWMDHLDNMTELRQGIGLRAYGQEDPVVAYKREGYEMFEEMIAAIQEETVRRVFVVQVRVKEGNRERLQAYEGVVVARRNRGLNSSFTVRKVSHGEGVERVFPLHSPTIAEIKVKRRGDVRRAKLYFLRERSGKSARIREKV